MRIERIMFPTDFSAASRAAIPWVARMAEMTAAQVFVVQVLRENPEAGPDPNYHYDAGYATALVGKWHMGALPWFSPLKSGYEEFFGFGAEPWITSGITPAERTTSG